MVVWFVVYNTNVSLNLFHKWGWIGDAATIVVATVAALTPIVVIGNEESSLRGVVSMACAFYFSRLWSCVYGDARQLGAMERVGHVQLSFHDIRACRFASEDESRLKGIARCLALLAVDGGIILLGSTLSQGDGGHIGRCVCEAVISCLCASMLPVHTTSLSVPGSPSADSMV